MLRDGASFNYCNVDVAQFWEDSYKGCEGH